MNLDLITPLVLTFNEAPNIARTLQALTWAREVVIVDSGSTDETLKIARSFNNTKVIHRPFDNHTNQWNFGISQVSTPWILSLDADYIVSAEFLDGIRRLDVSNPCSVYYGRFKFILYGRVLKTNIYPPRAVLFRRGMHVYIPDGHTQKLDIKDQRKHFIDGYILHDDRKAFERWGRNQIQYAQLEAQKLLSTPPSTLGRNDRLRLKLWIVPLLMPWYLLLIKGLWRDGLSGWAYILQRTCAEILIALAVIEQKNQRVNSRHPNLK
ncbi:MAG: glycosyltransferase family 2 protein [Methylacidiphilales bacterium]|nr:glycosyltransferase family 2 protein [Candidatus Methylacidiphilales bacterium]MDW8348944.1 glycosyltransferase family 2 protein [Verrucomicrobiae bacterium]